MSTLSVANIHFESTANNRVQYVGSNTITVSTAGTERVRIDNLGNTTFSTTMSITGNVGIGMVSSSSYKLDVNGNARFNNQIYLTATASEAQMLWSLPSSRLVYLFGRPSDSVFGLYDTTLAAPRWFTDTSGNFTTAGNVTAYSDIKLKTDISTIDNALDKVSRMRGVMFNRKDTGVRGTGVIAQEIQEILPEVVQEGETLSVAYGNIVGVLIEAIKELKAEIEQLKGK